MASQYGMEEPEERECPMCRGIMRRVVPTDGTRRYYRCERCTHTVGRTRVAFVAVLAVTAVILVGMMMYIASEFVAAISSAPG